MQNRKRLVLFDIDGTLLSSGGAGSRSLRWALRLVTGVDLALDGYSYGGKTDPQIVGEMLAALGMHGAAAEATIPAVLERYVELLRREMPLSEGRRLLPGVAKLLSALSDIAGVHQGLLTGNLEAGAAIKLGAFDLLRYFEVGAYGSDSPDRNALPSLALARAREQLGLTLEGKNLVIVGDTPYDIRCARTVGARTIAVATGPYSTAELARHDPDFLFPDLSDHTAVVDAILA